MKPENFESNFQTCYQKKQKQQINSNFIARKKKLKSLELERTANYLDNSEYITWKIKLDQLNKEKANGIRIKRKCDWYEYGEKSTKFFLNLKKIRPHQNKKRNKMKAGKDITDQKEAKNEFFYFYNNLFKSGKRSSKYDIAQFLNNATSTEKQSAKCVISIPEVSLFVH